MKVGEIYIALGLKRDGSWNQANSWLSGLKGAALGLLGVFGGTGLLKSGFGFNAMLQDSKVKVAEMMAIARKSTLKDQYTEAAKAVDELNELATKLPGNTEDYVKALSLISGPILSAKDSTKDLLDITVSTLAFAKLVSREQGSKLDVATSAREIQRAVDGTSRATDRLVLKMLGVAGVTMKQFKHMTALQREQILNSDKIRMRAKEFNDEQAKTFSGQKEQLHDRAVKLLARASEKLFERVASWMEKINNWFDENKTKVEAFADTVGSALADVAEAFGAAFKWLFDHPGEVKDALTAIAAIIGGVLLRNTLKWMRTTAPMFLIVYALVKLFKALQEHIGTVGAALAMAFAIGGILLYIGKLKEITGLLGIIGGAKGANLGGVGGAAGGGVAGHIPLIGAAIAADTAAREEYGGGLGTGASDRMTKDGLDKINAWLAPSNAIHKNDVAERVRQANEGSANFSYDKRGLQGDTLNEQLAILAEYTKALKARTGASTNVTATINVNSTREAVDAMHKIASERHDNTVRRAADNLDVDSD